MNPYAQLAHTHQLLNDLLLSIPEADAYRGYAADAPPLAWLFALANYRETQILREWLQHDEQLTARLRHLFTHATPSAEQSAALPPRDHLLNWALELQEENLTRLANPKQLPPHPALQEGRLLHHILRHHSQLYEAMLTTLGQRQLASDSSAYLVTQPLQPSPPNPAMVEVMQGHYRIGAPPDDPAAVDNELPTQVVQLSTFQIALHPVSNAEYLTFIHDGGYQRRELWGADHHPTLAAPRHWQRDRHGAWYGIGLGGPYPLLPSTPVTGINRDEAEAYARWIATHDQPFSGAILQHEYQWEAAARLRLLRDTAIAWEWCANPFHPYTDFSPFPDPCNHHAPFDQGLATLRGGSLHSQPPLKRLSYRHLAPPQQRHPFAGIRLVYPPAGSGGK